MEIYFDAMDDYDDALNEYLDVLTYKGSQYQTMVEELGMLDATDVDDIIWLADNLDAFLDAHSN